MGYFKQCEDHATFRCVCFVNYPKEEIRKMPPKTKLKSGDESLKKAAQHGQQEHGRKEFNEDVIEGVHVKTRDVKSPQIRGGQDVKKPSANPKAAKQ